MAWETRERGGHYYTRSHKVGGRVVREYVGAWDSPTAQVAAAEDAMRREARDRALADHRMEQERDAEAELPLEVLSAVGDALLGAALVVGGYRRHDRGEWRRKRRA